VSYHQTQASSSEDSSQGGRRPAAAVSNAGAIYAGDSEGEWQEQRDKALAMENIKLVERLERQIADSKEKRQRLQKLVRWMGD